MNAPVLVAQLSGSAPQSSASPKNLKIAKPQNGQAVTIHLDGNTKLDFGDISTEKLTFVRVGEKLIVLFDNQSTVTVDPVFDSSGHPLADVAFDLGQNRLVTGDEFAALFPITTDQSVLPAAGNSGPTGGANFSDAHVNALGDPNSPLALLGNENGNSPFGSTTQDAGSQPTASQPFSNAGLSESNLPGGSTENAGPTTITGFLGVNFGSGLGSASLTFNELQPGLANLRSEGQVVNFALNADHTMLIGFVGGDANVVANQVFIVTLNLAADSSYTVTLLRPLDHGGVGADTLGFTLDITASDQFGSVDTQINVSVQDDVSGLIGDVAAQGVGEDGLADANGFVADAGSTGAVDLNIRWGADNDTQGNGAGDTFGRALSFLAGGVPAVAGENGAALSSGGVALQYVVTTLANGGELLTAYKGDARGDEARVFTVTLDPTSAHGSYSFNLLGTLDHATGSDSIALTFAVQAADADGDAVDTSFTVNVADDAPVARDVVAKMAENDVHVITLVEGVDYSFGTDTHSAAITISPPTFSDVPAGIVLGTPMVTLDANGNITIAPGTAFDALSVGATAVMHIPYTVTDGDGDTITKDIAITITGTNDAPMITGEAQFGAVTDVAEAVNPAASAGELSATGTIGFADVDLSDRPTADFALTSTTPSSGLVLTSAQEAALTGAFAIAPGGANANNGAVDWTYAIAESEVDFLAAGESVVLTYTVTVADGHGGSVDQVVTITVTGANDTPVITTQEQTGGVADVAEAVNPAASAGELSATGTIGFADVDLSDRPTADFALTSTTPSSGLVLTSAQEAALTGAFAIAPGGANANDGTVGWTYTIAESEVDFLAAGESVVLTYTVTVADGHGGNVDQAVTITVTGANDAPVISVATGTGTVTEDAANPNLTATGTITFDDVDLSDTHNVDVTKTSGSLGGTLTPVVIDPATGVGSGTVNWTYSVANAATQYLARNETTTETFTISISDGHGGSVDQVVTITIRGTNDAPVLTAATGEWEEWVDTTGSLGIHSVSGTIGFTDVDLNDVGHQVDVTNMSASGVTDGLSSAELVALRYFALEIDGTTKAAGSSSGSAAWTFRAVDGSFDYLAEGQTVTLTYTVRVRDFDGGQDTDTITITVRGTNDRPEFNLVNPGALGFGAEFAGQTGGTADQVVTGTLHFRDADRDDVGHEANAVFKEALGVTSGLDQGAIQNAVDVTAVGKNADSTNGTVAWRFAADDATFDYLAAGEAVVLAYDVTVDDKEGLPNSTDTITIYVTILGTNDAPVIVSGPISLTDSELTGVQGSTAVLAHGGTFVFDDVDLSNTHTASAVLTGMNWNGGATIPSDTQTAIEAALSAAVTTAATGAGSGEISWNFSLQDHFLDFLAANETLTLTYTVTVTDDALLASNSSASQTVTVTITGTNDAPVITSGNAVASIVEPGDLGFINEAGLSNPSDGGRPGLEPTVAVDSVLSGHIVAGMSVADMTATLAAVKGALGAGATDGDAIAAVWEYLDARYSYTDAVINEAQAKLAIVYAEYLQGGGMALLDVVAKYTPDGADGGGAPDRVQSLHDNILGNLNWYGLADKLGSGSDAYHRIEAAVGSDPVLSGLFHDRPYYGGDEGEANGATAWDIGHGLYPAAQGTMVASDVDTASTDLTWTDVTGSAGAYGIFAIDAGTGAWTYVLNPGAADPLKGGEQAVETFTVQVSDGHGGIDTATVTVTITGTNDAPYDLDLSANTFPAVNASYRIGEITVSDIDDNADFTFTVSDNRFTVVTDVGSGDEHYYLETNQQVDGLPPSIAITVTDLGGLSYTESFAVTAPVQLFAADRTTLLGSFTTIQAAVDAAHGVGDFILVGDGTYKEQVVIDPTDGHGVDGLVIRGAGNVIVEAPDTLVSTGHSLTGAMRTVDGIITVSNAHGVVIEGLTVDGNMSGSNVTGSNDPTLVGIAYLNASGTVDDVTVTGVRESDAMFGMQRGIGIYVSNDDAQASNTFTLTDSRVEDFQKGAVVVINADVTITGNIIEGAGATSLTAQNGIQLVGATGEVSHNTITGIGYIPQSWTASGILFWDSHDLQVTDNTITGPVDGGHAVSFTAIYGMNSSNVEVTDNAISHVWYGIVGYEDGTFSSGTFAPTWTVGDSNTITDASALALDFEVAATNTHPFDVAGTAGNDYFLGGAGADHFQGNDGDDTFVAIPGGGADVFDGGNGTDELDLSRLSGRVTVDLNAGMGGFAADGLTFTGIENVTLNTSDTSGGVASSVVGNADDNVITGSGRADVIYGRDGDDTITGNDGDDTISGGRGADHMDGGAGTNTLLLDARVAGEADVTHVVNLTTGAVSGGQLDGDTIANFANVTAAHNTRADFTGDGNANVLTGSNENDVLRGGGGDDTLIGDLGYAGTPNADTLIGGSGNDTLVGGGGNDTLYGNDTNVGVAGQDRDPTPGESDTAIYSGVQSGYEVTLNSDGSFKVKDIDTTDGNEGVDTLFGIEGINFNGGPVELNLLANVRLFDGDPAQGGHLIGTFDTIQAAVDAVSASGQYITLAANTYHENVALSHGVTVLGAEYGNAVGGRSDTSVESVIAGQWTITTTDAVKLDGLYFTNTSPAGVTSDATLSIMAGGTGAGHVVTNTIFFSAIDGGDTKIAVGPDGDGDDARDDRAIFVSNQATSGQITIEDNLITGSSGKYGTAGWGRGVWSDGGGADLTIARNTFENVRSGLNLDDNTPNSPVLVTDNTFSHNGTAISLGDQWSGDLDTRFVGNNFDDVDLEFNLGHLAQGVTLHGTAAVAGQDATDHTTAILGGSGNDNLGGTSGNDAIEGGGGNDQISGGAGHNTLVGEGGNDLFFVTGGDDAVYGNNYAVNPTGSDLLATAGESDTVVYYGDPSNFQITQNADLSWRVHQVDTNTTDTLYGIEGINFKGGPVELNLLAAVQLFDTNNFLVGTFDSIGSADLQAANGYRIVIAGQITNEAVTLTHDNLTVEGQADDTGIVLTLGAGIVTLTLAGDAPINVIGNGLANVINGNDGNNVIEGGAGIDTLNGGAGNDTLIDGAGTHFNGGDGVDTVDLSQLAGRADVNLSLTAGTGGFAADKATFTGIENLILNTNDHSGGSASQITGNEVANRIEGSGRADVIYGRDGDDTITGNDGDDTISGGRGADHMDGGAGTNTLLLDARDAGDPDDIHFVDLSDGTVSGGQLAGDTIANFANVTAAHNTRADFTGDGNANVLTGSNENDVLRGGGGDDTLIGDLGYAGTPNADVLIGGSGNDTLIGGGGFDTADYHIDSADGANHGIIANLSASTIVSSVATGSNVNVGAGTVFDGFGDRDTLTGIERIVATAYDDALYGGAGGQTLEGQGGNDYIVGGSGNDTLNGDAGDDTIAASAGDDTMNGGDGNDTFLISQNVGGTQVIYGGDGEDIIKLQQAGTIAVLRGDFGAANSVEHVSGIANGNQMSVLTGDLGNNTLDFRGTELTNVVVQGGAGDDVIYASTQSNSIISAAGGGHDVFHGSSTDTTYRVSNNYSGATQVFDGGAGRDTIQLLQAGTIARLTGNFNVGGDSNSNSNNIDAIIGSAYGGQLSQIIGDGQNNVLDFRDVELTNVIVGGGAGGDTIYASTISNTIISMDGGGNDVFHGSATNTTYRLNNNSAGATTVLDGGTGTDTIVLQQAGTKLVLSGNFNAGGNTDTNSNSVEAVTGTASGNAFSTLFGDSSANTLDFRGTVLTNVAINAGGGNDTVYVSQVSPGSISYDGGAGIDTLVIALTPDQLLNTDLLAQINALTPGSGANGSVNDPSLSFSAASFEHIELQAQIGGALVALNNPHFLDGTDNHQDGMYTPILTVTQNVNDSWFISGLGGDDVLRGGSGNDVLIGGIGRDTMDGGEGSDTYLIAPGDGPSSLGDNFHDSGAAADYDRIVATANGAQIVINGGLSGIEEINAAGSAGVNIVGATAAHNVIDLAHTKLVGIGEVQGGGGTSDDTFYTSSDSDAVGGQNYRGGPGSDVFHFGTDSTNLLVSSTDNGGFDSFADNVLGDGTIHTLKAMDNGTDIGIATLYGNLADHSNSVDVITADNYTNVRIVGSGDHNVWDFSQTDLVGIDGIYTNGGDDSIIGSAGDDVIDGGTGGDWLKGGLGADRLTGGDGNDHFRYDATNEGGDYITDFGNGTDSIDILASAFGLTTSTDVASIFASSGDSDFTSSSERFHFDTTSHTLYYDADGSGGGAALALATFDHNATVLAQNIHLV